MIYGVLFAKQYFDRIWPAILIRARSRPGQRAHDSKCLNEVYKAYVINLSSYKSYQVKSKKLINVKKTQKEKKRKNKIFLLY